MKKIIALEEVAQFGLAIYAINLMHLDINVWILSIAFFIPDLFAIGYLINKATGAIMYNLAHHKMIAIALIASGYILKLDYLLLTGLLFYAHSSFDRALGYGLKYPDSPNRTHLGLIGKEKYKNV